MFLWYAYRLDIMAGGEFIAPDCPGTGENGRCYFDEFLQYIQKDSDKVPWAWTTTVGKQLRPNLNKTAQELYDLFYDQKIDPERLYGKARSEARDFRTLIGPVVDNIQKCRQILINVDIDEELGGVRQSMAYMTDARIADQAPFMIDQLNDLLKENGNNWVCCS